jgi:hypothetical protein
MAAIRRSALRSGEKILIKFLNRRFPNENFPPVIIYIYYLLISFTFCYLYYHKFIVRADFYGNLSPSGIYSVLSFEAIKPLQYRLLMPFIFKAIQVVVYLVYPIPDKALFFLITIGICCMILLSFYFLLNEYFKSKATNCWLAPIIIYPMVWNFVIMNGQFFYMDFSVLLIMIMGFIAIIKKQHVWLTAIFVIGIFNHPSSGYLIPCFLLFNYNRLLKKDTIFYTILMSVLYIGIYEVMDYYFPNKEGHFIINNLRRNIGILNIIPLHIFIRDFLFNFGGLHFILFIFLITGLWKRYKGPMLYINLIVVPYTVSVLFSFSIEEIRNYIAIIPFILISGLLFLSTFENSFLKPVDRVFTGGGKN